MTDKRPDETDDFTKHEYSGNDVQPFKGELEVQSNFEMTDLNKEKSLYPPLKENKILKLILSLFCGFEYSQQKISTQQSDESKRRIESFNSINQTKTERYILNFNLLIITMVAISLFIFFSIPPEYHIFKNLNLNLTKTE